MASALRTVTREDEDNLRQRLEQAIDQARRGSIHAAAEAARLLLQLGSFDGPAAKMRRYVYAQWLKDVDPDVASAGWAQSLRSRGGR